VISVALAWDFDIVWWVSMCRLAGFFGYSHLTGGWEGGQAEFVRVPFGKTLL
jgi:threonine dehydrogenase-like Zn-dependent dehydrogenase